jgi:hypothetical protein
MKRKVNLADIAYTLNTAETLRAKLAALTDLPTVHSPVEFAADAELSKAFVEAIVKIDALALALRRAYERNLLYDHSQSEAAQP